MSETNLLDREIARLTKKGWQIVSLTDTSALVRKPKLWNRGSFGFITQAKKGWHNVERKAAAARKTKPKRWNTGAFVFLVLLPLLGGVLVWDGLYFGAAIGLAIVVLDYFLMHGRLELITIEQRPFRNSKPMHFRVLCGLASHQMRRRD